MDGLLTTLAFHQPLLHERVDGACGPLGGGDRNGTHPAGHPHTAPGPPFWSWQASGHLARGGHDPCWRDDRSVTRPHFIGISTCLDSFLPTGGVGRGVLTCSLTTQRPPVHSLGGGKTA